MKMSLADIQAHQRKHGFPVSGEPVVPSAAVAAAPEPVKRKAGGLAKPRGRKGMNRTEAAYSLILEAKKRAFEVDRWEREGITLRWPDGMTYTADFVIWGPPGITLLEAKGPWIEQDALVKFRAARAHWPEFAFEMWQLKGGAWTQLL